jgi:hypothetical protein
VSSVHVAKSTFLGAAELDDLDPGAVVYAGRRGASRANERTQAEPGQAGASPTSIASLSTIEIGEHGGGAILVALSDRFGIAARHSWVTDALNASPTVRVAIFGVGARLKGFGRAVVVADKHSFFRTASLARNTDWGSTSTVDADFASSPAIDAANYCTAI